MAGWWVGSGEDDGKGQGWGWNDQRVEGRSIFVICFLTFFYQINLVFILHWRHFINIPAFLSLGTHILLFYRCSLVRRRTEVLNPVKINPSSVFNLSTSTDSTFPTIKRSLTSLCELYSSFWKKIWGCGWTQLIYVYVALNWLSIYELITTPIYLSYQIYLYGCVPLNMRITTLFLVLFPRYFCKILKLEKKKKANSAACAIGVDTQQFGAVGGCFVFTCAIQVKLISIFSLYSQIFGSS